MAGTAPARDPLEVLGRARIADVEISGCAHVPMRDDRHAANDHELDAPGGERLNELSKIRDHQRAAPPQETPQGAACGRAARLGSIAGSPQSGSDRRSAAAGRGPPSATESRAASGSPDHGTPRRSGTPPIRLTAPARPTA